LEEIRDNQKWVTYLKERSKFHQAQELLDIYVGFASFQAKLRKMTPLEKEQLQKQIAVFNSRANGIIDRIQ
jgi:hypothetical protein